MPTGCRSIAADDARLQPFRDCLADGEPLCGRLQPEKHALLYGVRAEEVQSSALLPLPGVGLVAVGSRDANRFFPGMGTLFLRMMGESLAAALKRYAVNGLPTVPSFQRSACGDRCASDRTA